MTRRIAKYWLLVTAATGLAVAILTPEPVAKSQAKTIAGDGWAVPRVSSSGGQEPQLVAALLRSSLWGRQADTAITTDDLGSGWRIAGITGTSRDRLVLVHFGDDRILPLKAGEKFPDGTPIAEVRENGVCVTLSGKRRFLPLSGQNIPIVW